MMMSLKVERMTIVAIIIEKDISSLAYDIAYG